MPAEQLTLLLLEEPCLPAPLPPSVTGEAIQRMADLLLQVVTAEPTPIPATQEVNDEVLR